MPTINIDPSFPNHVKTLRLMRMAGNEAMGYLVSLWCHAAEHFPLDGRLVGYSDADIEGVIRWPGESGVFANAIREAGFLDADMTLHDWHEHEAHLRLYIERAEMMRKHKSSKKQGNEQANDSGNDLAKPLAKSLGNDLANGQGKPLACSPVTVTVTDSVTKIIAPNGASSTDVDPTEAHHDVDYDQIVREWNQLAGECKLPGVMGLSKKRKVAVRQRLCQKLFDRMQIYQRIRGSPWMRGDNDRGWRIDFDFVWLSENNFLKVLEGKYDKAERVNGNGVKPEFAKYDQIGRN